MLRVGDTYRPLTWDGRPPSRGIIERIADGYVQVQCEWYRDNGDEQILVHEETQWWTVEDFEDAWEMIE